MGSSLRGGRRVVCKTNEQGVLIREAGRRSDPLRVVNDVCEDFMALLFRYEFDNSLLSLSYGLTSRPDTKQKDRENRMDSFRFTREASTTKLPPND